MSINMNRLVNLDNKYQKFDTHKRVVTVCSAGLLRSPTAALVLSQSPYNFNTRSCGLSKQYALNVFDHGLAHWGDEFVCMEKYQATEVLDFLNELDLDKPVFCLDIPDEFAYRDERLMSLIREAYEKKKRYYI